MGYTIGLTVGIALSTALSPLPVAHDAPRNQSIHYKQLPAFVPPPCTNLIECRGA